MMKERVITVEATAAHIPVLAGKLRPSMLEGMKLTGLSPERIIEACYRESSMRRTALLDGEVAGMWGCAGVMLGGSCEAWLFASEVWTRFPRSMLRIGLSEMARFRAVFRNMHGIILNADEKACRFAERLGCVLQPDGEPFRLYEVA